MFWMILNEWKSRNFLTLLHDDFDVFLICCIKNTILWTVLDGVSYLLAAWRAFVSLTIENIWHPINSFQPWIIFGWLSRLGWLTNPSMVPKRTEKIEIVGLASIWHANRAIMEVEHHSFDGVPRWKLEYNLAVFLKRPLRTLIWDVVQTFSLKNGSYVVLAATSIIKNHISWPNSFAWRHLPQFLEPTWEGTSYICYDFARKKDRYEGCYSSLATKV